MASNNGQNGAGASANHVHQQQQPPFVPVSTAQQQQFASIPPHQPQAQLNNDMFVQMLTMMQQQHYDMLVQFARQQQQFTQQQQRNDERQERLFQSFASSIKVQVPPNTELILDSLASNIKEFRFEADSNVTFAAWYSRYDDLFEKDAAKLDDEAKVRLLLRKLGASEHERYVSYILPKLPKNFTFAETVAKLKSLFGAEESVISRRYRCLQIAKNPVEDHVAFACRVNKAFVEFELGKLSEEQFKSLVYVCGLKSENDVENRTRLLARLLIRTCLELLRPPPVRTTTARNQGPSAKRTPYTLNSMVRMVGNGPPVSSSRR
ncbi:uncharacterized protein LOC129728681 [Wyeomyia smithii]|uniref:uncharacterized protein LOC129728681 n=1 Tax=Wyeomyia smithii TaxID=174621 RepID=UPI00246805F4|nr:uncharacterized protein LOC129728681 [Wyeomyia smithii]